MEEAALRSGQPAYLNLRDQISQWILEGRFGNGDRLPSIRNLAAQAGLNPLTVVKAYHHLVGIGVVEMRQGVGIFVAGSGVERLRQFERARFLTEEWPAVCQHMKRLELDARDMIARAQDSSVKAT
ncbi:MAG: GntR family transcriptional regulator [Sphingosinicella sp.]|uniref:GntR family transcriptional regulator n=1 Tax=Sphingosinicella sp. TaxID=1917971 RepID=UPI004037C416